MGFYIDGPAKGKAPFLRSEYDAEFINEPVSFKDIPKDKALICVVDNGPFEAAGFAFDNREFEVFSAPGDPRPKRWMIMDREKAVELTGFKQY